MPTKLAAALVATMLCLLAVPAASADEAEVTGEPRALHDPGTWSLHAYGSASFGDEAGEIYEARVGGERHWNHGLALEISGVVGYFDADPIMKEAEEEGMLVGFDLLFRWYFHRREKWVLYTDAGAGGLWFESEFPTHEGTSFNFEPQAGMGFARRIGPDMWFFAGARWHHISNADIVGDSDNRGYDAAMPYVGFTWLR